MELYLLYICIGEFKYSIQKRLCRKRSRKATMLQWFDVSLVKRKANPGKNPCQSSACSWQSRHGYLWLRNTERREDAKEDASSTEAKPRMLLLVLNMHLQFAT